jgi:S-adenosylmethionine:tRNA ribosyltransferase-isomerase
MHAASDLTVDDFDYELPERLIAQHPLPERSASRLLEVDGRRLHDRSFADLPQLLRAGDLLVFNDTRVIPARLHGVKPTGGKVEVLVERVLEPDLALAMVRTSHAPQAKALFLFGGNIEATVEGRRDDLFLLRFNDTVDAILQRHGRIPLPPYIAHAPDESDRQRYQTVYAARAGAVAAPTAGLHFDEPILARLRTLGVELAWLTLHVGAGTFQPVRTHSLAEHTMHSEWFEIGEATARAVNGAHAAGRRVIAVGTTTLRALEAAALAGRGVQPGAQETALFITPGFEFKVVDLLLTNFHLPRSTLLMLVSAFAGLEPIRAAYRHAVAHGYRFFSYGDAMLVARAP